MIGTGAKSVGSANTALCEVKTMADMTVERALELLLAELEQYQERERVQAEEIGRLKERLQILEHCHSKENRDRTAAERDRDTATARADAYRGAMEKAWSAPEGSDTIQCPFEKIGILVDENWCCDKCPMPDLCEIALANDPERRQFGCRPLQARSAGGDR